MTKQLMNLPSVVEATLSNITTPSPTPKKRQQTFEQFTEADEPLQTCVCLIVAHIQSYLEHQP